MQVSTDKLAEAVEKVLEGNFLVAARAQLLEEMIGIVGRSDQGLKLPLRLEAPARDLPVVVADPGKAAIFCHEGAGEVQLQRPLKSHHSDLARPREKFEAPRAWSHRKDPLAADSENPPTANAAPLTRSEHPRPKMSKAPPAYHFMRKGPNNATKSNVASIADIRNQPAKRAGRQKTQDQYVIPIRTETLHAQKAL